MPATVRYDAQYCPIARALDVLGDRWTLLILRDLVVGDQRFTDLRRNLKGIAPTVLTQRLRTMTEQGLITTDDPGSHRARYRLTERGRSATTVMNALARWGMPLLGEPDEDTVVRPWTAVNVAVSIYYDPQAAEGVDERYEFHVEGDIVTLSSVKGGGAPHESADVVLESDARLWLDIRRGQLTLREARREGRVKVTGKAAAVANFQRIFHVP